MYKNLAPAPTRRGMSWLNLSAEVEHKQPEDLCTVGNDYSLSVEFRYRNGLGFSISIIKEDGTYWILPSEPHRLAGTMTIECIVKFKEGVIYGDKELERAIPAQDHAHRRAILEAINNPTTRSTFNNLHINTWCYEVNRHDFQLEETLYVPQLNVCVSTITKPNVIPDHPSSVDEVINQLGAFDSMDLRGAFKVNRNNTVPPLFMHFTTGAVEVPTIDARMSDGLYVFERIAGETHIIPVDDKSKYDPSSPTCIYPLYATKEEALYGTWEQQQQAKKRRLEDEIAELKVSREEYKLELDRRSSEEKLIQDKRAYEQKDYYAERSYERQDGMDFWKGVLALTGLGITMFKLLS